MWSALLACLLFSVCQHPLNFYGVLSHVNNRNYGGHCRLNGKEDSEVAPADNRSPKEPLLSGKHLGIPLNPRYGLMKTLSKLETAIDQPRVVVTVGITKIILDSCEKLYWLAPHLRARRRPSSSSEIRSIFPNRYAFHRESSIVRCLMLTEAVSSTAAHQSSSAKASFWRLGSF